MTPLLEGGDERPSGESGDEPEPQAFNFHRQGKKKKDIEGEGMAREEKDFPVSPNDKLG